MKNGTPRALHGFLFAALFVMASGGAARAQSRNNHLDFKKKPPHYTGKVPKDAVVLAHELRVGSSFGAPSGDRDLAAVLDSFARECEQYLAELEISKPVAIPAQADRNDLPLFYVGHPDGFWAPTDAWSDEEREPHGRSVVVIALSDPPSRFSKQMEAPLRQSSATHVVYITVELSDYAVSQTNWKGSKAIELGTGHIAAVPWLTSLDQLAEVLQFKGALYRADGRFVRAGAEAFHAQRTPFRQAILNVQRTMRPDELKSALQAERADLPDEPLAWQIALRNLLGQLLGRDELLVVGS
jgi:hypothetical protein